ncbi:hypothetical protein K523DRAFT_288133 [Schizophyllum commune Tattone D]|nr:hypothetical protein K523DRAFT_288133 [Schizophyllum commune Tattone D]
MDKHANNTAWPSTVQAISKPFHFNRNGHYRFIHTVLCYRRKRTRLTISAYQSALELSIVHPTARFVPTNCAATGRHHQPMTDAFGEPPSNPRGAEVHLPTYVFRVNKDDYYTPFVASLPPEWMQPSCISRVETDVKKVARVSTLGPYSFQAHCQLADALLTGEVRPPALRGKAGHRKSEVVGHGVRKTMLAHQIPVSPPAFGPSSRTILMQAEVSGTTDGKGKGKGKGKKRMSMEEEEAQDMWTPGAKKKKKQ